MKIEQEVAVRLVLVGASFLHRAVSVPATLGNDALV